MLQNDETLKIDLDDLFKDPEEELEEAQETDSSNEEKDEEPKDNMNMTKNMSKRINEVRANTEKETKDAMAKELGYKDYEDFSKAREKEILHEAGLDEDEIEKVVQKLLDKRIAEDPRMKKLEEFEAKEKSNFVKEQLKEINKLTGSSYKSIEELPQDVLNLWEKIGNLKQAYLAIQGESFVTRSVANQQNGSLTHLANPGSSSSGTKVRSLTEDEKAIYRLVDPDLTDEELSKKTISID